MKHLFFTKHNLRPRNRAGFTILETLIYIGILGITSIIGVQIFVSLSDSYLRNLAQSEVTQNLRIARQIIEQSIEQTTAVTSASGSTLNLAMASSTINPTIFALSNGALTMQQGGGAAANITSNRVTVTSLSFNLVSISQSLIDPVNHWAWSGGASSTSNVAEGVGWVDFNPALGNVRVPGGGAGDLYGYAHADNMGYISLNCITTNSCGTISYKVSESATGTLSGWAWNDTYGWISFNSSDTTSTVPYSVQIASTTGDFTGWAWSENIGWISFNCNNSQVNSCGTVSYKVRAANPTLSRPLYAVNVSISMSYNNSGNPLTSYSDTANFSVSLYQPSVVTVSSINPAAGSSGSTVSNITVTGTNFASGAVVKLSRPGYLDIYPTTAFTYVNSTSLQSGAFNLTGAATGLWNVVVTDPDGEVGVLPNGFTVQ